MSIITLKPAAEQYLKAMELDPISAQEVRRFVIRDNHTDSPLDILRWLIYIIASVVKPCFGCRSARQNDQQYVVDLIKIRAFEIAKEKLLIDRPSLSFEKQSQLTDYVIDRVNAHASKLMYACSIAQQEDEPLSNLENEYFDHFLDMVKQKCMHSRLLYES